MFIWISSKKSKNEKKEEKNTVKINNYTVYNIQNENLQIFQWQVGNWAEKNS